MNLLFSTLGILIVWVIVIALSAKLYLKLTTGRCNSNVSLVGKTVIITGGDSGIGYETALDFAKRGAKVIIASFVDQKIGEAVARRIIDDTNNPIVFFKYMNLASINSVRKFAEEINKSENRLDILVNNAGALGLPPITTEDGLLLLMQTNYFGPFLLTILLLDLLKKTPNSRIVNVASAIAKYMSNLDVNNLNSIPQKGIPLMMHMIVYTRSKLGSILFTIALDKILKNTSTTTYSVHPGATRTSIIKNRTLILRFSDLLSSHLIKNPRAGAETSIHCSITKGIEIFSGHHFHDCHVVQRYKAAQDPELPKKLWKMTEKLLNLN